MNRVLQRPMFRIGGSAGTGITSGLDQPRAQYASGTDPYDTFEKKIKELNDAFERYKEMGGTLSYDEFKKKFAAENFNTGGRVGYANGTPSFQATGLPGFLTQFGLNLLSTPPQGNIFQTAAVSAQDPFRRLQASQAAAASTAEDRAFREKLLERQIASDEAIAAMKQKDSFFAAQTPEEQFRERLKVYGESSIPIIKNNATDIANFEVKHRNENYVQLDFVYDRGTKNFEPDFRSIPEGALTYNPKDGLAYRNEGGQFIKLNPFTLEPIDKIDGTE